MIRERPNPLRGVQCAHCSRDLDQRNSWGFHHDRFFCNALCRDAYEVGSPKTPHLMLMPDDTPQRFGS
jgi:hypothetical protein